MTLTDWASEGWYPWLDIPPPPSVLIEVTREYARPRVMYREQMWAETNAVGLYWRLTGIGREELNDRNERFDPEQALHLRGVQLLQSR